MKLTNTTVFRLTVSANGHRISCFGVDSQSKSIDGKQWVYIGGTDAPQSDLKEHERNA